MRETNLKKTTSSTIRNIVLGYFDEHYGGIESKIFLKLQNLGYTHKEYDKLMEAPFIDESETKTKKGFTYIDQGVESYVFLNKKTGKINKFAKYSDSKCNRGDKTVQKTRLDSLINQINKAASNNIASIILKTMPTNSTVNYTGVITENNIDLSNPVDTKKIKELLGYELKTHFYVDAFNTKKHAYIQPDGKLAIIDGVHLLDGKAASETQKTYFQKIIDTEIDKIIGTFPEYKSIKKK